MSFLDDQKDAPQDEIRKPSSYKQSSTIFEVGKGAGKEWRMETIISERLVESFDSVLQ